MARNAGVSCMHPPYPCRKARRSRKGGGSVAWWEKARGSKATKRDRASIRCAWRKLHCLNPSSHGYMVDSAEGWLTRRSGYRDMTDRTVLSCSSLSQRAPYRGIKGTNGRPKHTASLSDRNCGIAYTGDARKAHACMATESPYYSRWACNGFRSQSLRLDRHGYKRMVTTRENPSVWEEGRQPIFAIPECLGTLTRPDKQVGNQRIKVESRVRRKVQARFGEGLTGRPVRAVTLPTLPPARHLDLVWSNNSKLGTSYRI